MENSHALLVLNAIESLQPLELIRLLNHFGSPAEVLAQNRKLLGAVAGPTLAEKIFTWQKHFDPAEELRECKWRAVQWMDWNDARYPDVLRQIPQPPPVLYFRGTWQAQRDACALAIVGSRQASRYGVETARRLGGDLAQAGFAVISGLARGIDTAAHEGTLEAKGRTIAVMGSGFSDPYPRENIKLVDRIAETGLVLSEFPLSRPPLARNFPRRNRIISGLSMGVVIVEAARRSGSLITASHALEQGRSVFAVPGRLDSESSEGAHSLIKQGAKLVTSVKDIVEDLQYLLPKRILKGSGYSDAGKASGESQDAVVGQENLAALSAQERQILEILEAEPIGIEDIIKQSTLAAPEVAAGLLGLEMQGLVRQHPGKNFSRAVSLKTVEV